MNFELVNLGCKVNRVESDSISAQLLSQGWNMASRDADVCLVNTCAVTGEAARKTRKEINRMLERHPRAQVLVMGCAAAIDPGQLQELSGRVCIVGKDKAVQHCLSLEEGRGGQSEPMRVGRTFPTRVGIKVQDGCDNACTFCIVHVARGKATSVPYERIAQEVKQLALAQVREVVLTGIDLGAWRGGSLGLAGLVRSLMEIAPETRFRISSIEPQSVDDDLIDLLSQSEGMLCRHLHLPLQSGSSQVLADMARRYDADQYLGLVSRLRDAVPRLSLSTDVIAGFPGETDEDFRQTVEACEKAAFSRMHVFRYSKRPGTPAAERMDQIEPAVVARRATMLKELASKLMLADGKSRLGTTEMVVAESKRKGRTESYFEIALDDDAEAGTLFPVVLSHIDGNGVFSS